MPAVDLNIVQTQYKVKLRVRCAQCKDNFTDYPFLPLLYFFWGIVNTSSENCTWQGLLCGSLVDGWPPLEEALLEEVARSPSTGGFLHNLICSPA